MQLNVDNHIFESGIRLWRFYQWR